VYEHYSRAGLVRAGGKWVDPCKSPGRGDATSFEEPCPDVGQEAAVSRKDRGGGENST
jgi:hypothetical protein